jgi:hypothetical protein
VNPSRNRPSDSADRIDGDDSPADARSIIYGVDFSGARDAGSKIWIASAAVEAGGNGLRIERCYPVADAIGTTERAPALEYLREFIARERRAVIGLDFSFGVPRAVADAPDWRAFACDFTFENVEEMVDTYVTRAREYTDGERTYLKRATDAATGASSPYGFVVVAQTLYGVRDVLRPLVCNERVSVLPMDDPSDSNDPDDERPWLCEIYPAATLRDLGLPNEKYKNDGKYPEARERRERIVAGLRDAGVTVTDDIAATAIADAGGDALDSVVAALAVFRALDDGRLAAGTTPDERTGPEGHIYV